MAENTKEKPKTHAEAKRAYDALAKQCTEFAARLPKIRVEIEKRVKEEMGKVEVELAALKAKKAAAAQEMFAAFDREAPEREAKAAADAVAKDEAERQAQAKANAKRQAELAKNLSVRVADAVK